MGLYVETRIRADMDTLWARTQDPAVHQRWDLRFTQIVRLPAPEGDADAGPGGEEGAPYRFRYATRVVPGLVLAGTGVAAGQRRHADGSRTSALRFASPHPLSLLAEGSGYWRYVPDGDGVRFLTGYDYRPRWGRFGRQADRWALRPLMGWATAWSFDRLRLWCERGIPPERSLLHGLLEAAVRALAIVTAVAWSDAGPFATLTAAVTALAAVLLPPLPCTPAARRCRRRPRSAARPPVLLRTLTASEASR